MRTSNPVLTDQIFARESRPYAQPSDAMTVNGTVVKTGLLMALLLGAAGFSASQVWPLITGSETGRPPWLIGGLIACGLGGLVVAIVTVFKPNWSPVTAPIYAVLEGLLLGAISAMFEAGFKGIVLQAVALTSGVMIVMLLAYVTRVIQVTNKLRTGIVVATGAICLVYLVSFVLRLFGVNMPYIHDAGPIGIIFSLVVVGVAAFNLLLDFDFIERGSRARAAKYMEWFAGFGLLVTLVWLYLEILNLLAKLRSYMGQR